MNGGRYVLRTRRELEALEEVYLAGSKLVAVHAAGKGEDFKLVLERLSRACDEVNKAKEEIKGC